MSGRVSERTKRMLAVQTQRIAGFWVYDGKPIPKVRFLDRDLDGKVDADADGKMHPAQAVLFPVLLFLDTGLSAAEDPRQQPGWSLQLAADGNVRIAGQPAGRWQVCSVLTNQTRLLQTIRAGELTKLTLTGDLVEFERLAPDGSREQMFLLLTSDKRAEMLPGGWLRHFTDQDGSQSSFPLRLTEDEPGDASQLAR